MQRLDGKASITIVDAQKRSRLGGGKLLDYPVRSNTSASRFIFAVTGNRQPAKSAAGQGPDETSLDVSFTMDEQEQSQMDEETFKNLQRLRSYYLLKGYGRWHAPLQRGGHFLTDASK